MNKVKMPKLEEKKPRVVQGTKIPVARNAAHFFDNTNNLERANGVEIKANANMKKRRVYTSTPRSSRNSGEASQPMRSLIGILKSPMAEKRITTFSNIHINFNFATVGIGLVESTVAARACPFVFSASDQSSLSPVKEKNEKRSFKKQSSNVHQGSKAKIAGFGAVGAVRRKLSDLRLERHQQMFKSRYAKKSQPDDGNIGGIRLNRRFDLLMKFREDQMDATRLV